MNSQNPGNILWHELIGLEAKVIRSTNKSHIGISGTIVDESRKTLIIKEGEGHKRVPKKDSIFRLRLECREVEVEGTALYGRPEDRVKKKIKKRW